MINPDKTPSTDSIVMLNSLRTAVQNALDKKKRLGQYAVIWSDNQIIFIGPDAPEKSLHVNTKRT